MCSEWESFGDTVLFSTMQVHLDTNSFHIQRLSERGDSEWKSGFWLLSVGLCYSSSTVRRKIGGCAHMAGVIVLTEQIYGGLP